MYRYHTSLRCRPIAETLEHARRYARRFGITRVTDTTRLDNIGLPVFASIRPDAQPGSLCVSAGKGLREEEAMIGAYMEAIELAMAEPRRGLAPVVRASWADVLDGRSRPEAVLDFCPRLHAEIPLEEETDCVWAEDLFSGEPFLVPAELVFIPGPSGASGIFGSSSNGLSSGNSQEEATIHGLLEVIERDILSFQTLRADMYRVDPVTLPAAGRELHELVRRAGHELVIRYARNAFDMPFFMSTLIDGQVEDPLFVNGGYGCHFFRDIALLRSATEAIQSRLSYIHGGRDDLEDSYDAFSDWDYADRAGHFRSLTQAIRDTDDSIDFGGTPSFAWQDDDLPGCLHRLLDLLGEHGIRHVLRVRFTQPEEPLQVVKMIVPRLEFFTPKSGRIGPRLYAYASSIANGDLRRPQPEPPFAAPHRREGDAAVASGPA